MLFSYAWLVLVSQIKLVCMTFCSVCWCCTTTLHLSLPAGWEGWGLHQPPWVQNRPSHRVQTEIVSVSHMSPKITNQAHVRSPTQREHAQTHCAHAKTLISPSSPWLTAVPSKPVIRKSRASSLPQIVLRKWTGELLWIYTSFWACVGWCFGFVSLNMDQRQRQGTSRVL